MKYISVFAVVVCLSACGGFLSREPLPERVSYLIELPAETLAGETGKRCEILRLDTVSAAIGQLSSRMHYKERAQRLESFAYSKWIDAPVDMIEPQLRRALNESGLFEAVVAANSPVRSDLSLTISHVSLLLDMNRSPTAVVLEADLELADPLALELVASGRVSVTEEAAANPTEAARAANRAVEQFAQGVFTFLRNATDAGVGCDENTPPKE